MFFDILQKLLGGFLPVMRQQFLDCVDRMIIDAGNDITQPHPGINTVHLTDANEAIDFCQPLGSLMASGE